jgi:hypothetical protein
MVWIEDEVGSTFRHHQNNLAAFFLFSKPNIFPSSVLMSQLAVFATFIQNKACWSVHKLK